MPDVKEILECRGISPSFHRIKILEYLMGTTSHPTADDIYNEIYQEIPTLSKTTVYNSLKTFAEKGLAQTITIETNEIRYDADLGFHAHLKCATCGKVYDLAPATLQCTLSTNIDGHKIEESHLYFKGICKNCL